MDTKQRWIGAALAVIALALLAGGAQTHAWWTGSSGGGSIGVGLRDVYMCIGDRCASMRMVQMGQGFDSDNWYRAGMATSVGAVLASALLAALAAALVFGKRNALLARVVVVASGVAAVTGATYVALFPGQTDTSIGYSVLLYFGGAIAGVAAGIVGKRASQLEVTP